MKEYDFYIVPTPIGNLGDITYRAVDILKNVDIIACEDVRVTQKLLNRYNVKTQCISYHKFNEKERISYFLNLLSEGKKIALVSDAGTPLFCDPGTIIVKELQEKGFSITSLAGANAVATFLSHTPRDAEDFAFVGFLPKTPKHIGDLLKKFCFTDMVFYDSPNRILKTLEIIKLNRPNCKVAIGRELTKIFEEIIIDNVDKVIEYYHNNPIKGEIAGMVYRNNNPSAENSDEKIRALQKKGFKAKEISVILSELYNYNKNDIYKRCL